jgi:hypothetical protein
MKVYLVLSEEWYGGCKYFEPRIFKTREQAEAHKKEWITRLNGTVDILIVEQVLV